MRGLRIAAFASAAVAVAAVTGAGVASASPAGATATAACAPGTLKVSQAPLPEGSAGMMHAGFYLVAKNTGKSTCTFQGYPGLALEGKGHTAINTVVHHGDTYYAKNPGVHEVTLKPGKAAYANIEWTHSGANAAKAKYLQASPTGSNSHSVISLDDAVDNHKLNVTAWAAKKPTA
ncbi:DUF4232 domain-containing protein [Streptomyces sp. NPDC014733]|uniref:DUF4232 domain-containing protein n=1 Tax=Streptomyces sp. NPDC014733 TaxID=3364885 RepID=UPI0036FD15F1